MKKFIGYFLTVLISVCIGCFSMYYMLTKTSIFGNGESVKVTNKVVTLEENSITKGVESVYDAVVVVEVYTNGLLSSTGTGFVYKKENGKAYILTNHHVISGKGEVKTLFTNGAEADAEIVASDEYADICVLTVEEDYATVVAKMGNNEGTRVGDTVFTIGAPMGKEYAGTVTRGIVSGKDRMVEVSLGGKAYDWVMNVMQTDAAINPGNSGGPLCNVNGEVIGINSLKIVKDEIEGIGFSIPIEDALEYAQKLEEGSELKRPYVGIEMIGIESSYQLVRSGINVDSNLKTGVVVMNVNDGSPASSVGIQKGDVITKIEEHNVSSVATFRYYLFKYNPGDTVKVTLNRNGKTMVLDVTLAEYK